LDVTAAWGAEGQRLLFLFRGTVEVRGETANWKITKLMEA
jgi:hypothetical protein